MYGSTSDDDLTRLIPPTERNKESSKSLGAGVCTNRIAIIFFLALMVCASIYFQSELTQLDTLHQEDETKIVTLQKIIRGHEQVIQRFNNSVTNTDVLKQLHSLQEQMVSNQDVLESELTSVQANISSQLKTTLNELADTVSTAELEISNEVAMVKDNVEQYVRTTQDQFSMENSFMVYQLAGTFTLLSCLISMWHMTAHLRHFNQPTVQRKILAILYMCPIYAITSWFSLVFHAAEGYLAIVKDFYEAYVIYQFLSFCIAVLGRGNRAHVVDILARHADHLSPPFRLDALCNKNPYNNDDRRLAEAVLLQCQFFAMQFVFIRPLSTIAMFVLDKYQYYGPTGNQWDYTSPQVYIVGIQNLSVFVAFTGLLKFYHAVDKDLAWCRPFAKFLCIKGVVFMTFWQGLAISILASATDVGGQEPLEWARSAQNFLICLEMLLFSIAHFYTFPTNEWEEGYRASHEANTRFGDSIALGDFVADLKILLKGKKKKKKKKIGDEDMSTVAEGDEDDDDDDDNSQVSSLTDPNADDVKKLEEAVEVALGDADDEAIDRLKELANRVMPGEDNDEEEQAGSSSSSSSYGEDSPRQEEKKDAAPDRGVLVDEEAPVTPPPNETSSLLGDDGVSSENEEILRPSIFTSISDIARNSPYK